MPGFNRNFDILDDTGNQKLNFIDDNVFFLNLDGQVSRINHLTQVLSNIGVDSRFSNTSINIINNIKTSVNLLYIICYRKNDHKQLKKRNKK